MGEAVYTSTVSTYVKPFLQVVSVWQYSTLLFVFIIRRKQCTFIFIEIIQSDLHSRFRNISMTCLLLYCCVLTVWVRGLYVNICKKTTQVQQLWTFNERNMLIDSFHITYTRWSRIHIQLNKCSYFWFKMLDPYQKL